MGKYEENISDNSLWVTVTPTPLARTLPFYISEAGHFTAYSDYRIQRETHDSFLMLYTIAGQGLLRAGENAVSLSKGFCAVVDCHMPHEYYTACDEWEFLWIHFNGGGIEPLFDIIYPSGAVRALDMTNFYGFENKLLSLIRGVGRNDVAGCIDASLNLHALLNLVYASAVENGRADAKRDEDIRLVIEFIENNYSKAISVDDIIESIHVSKYHFIRRFKRAMGITPYSYLTNYRINMSKMLLRSTDKTVSEIAGMCGFLDTSNFITHFKKRTGQKPLQYRRDFL